MSADSKVESVRKRVLTGDTPTGALHLGHYVGSLEQRLEMQETCDCFFLIANWHALTTRPDDVAGIRSDTIRICKDWLAVGLDPVRATFFVQSEVPAIAELTWYFSMLIGYGRLMKNPTIKDEIRVKALGENYSFGFLLYPVGQVADILAFRPDFVPVGVDQVPHIEMTREVARRFNQLYCGVDAQVSDEDQFDAGGVFRVPEARVGRVGRLTGTDGKNKMSKSLGNAIFLSDDPKTVKKKCNRIFTGRGSMDDPPVLEGNTVLEYLDTFCTDRERLEELKGAYERSEVGDGAIKKELGECLNAFIEPIREKRERIGDDEVIDVLRDGTRRANEVAERTLWEAKESASFGYFKRELGFEK